METENTKSQIEIIDKLITLTEKKPTVALSIVLAAVIAAALAALCHLNISGFLGFTILAALFFISFIFFMTIFNVLKALLLLARRIVIQVWLWISFDKHRKAQALVKQQQLEESEARKKVFARIKALPNESKLLLFVWLKRNLQTVVVPMNNRDPLPFVGLGLMEKVESPQRFQFAFRFRPDIWEALQQTRTEILKDPVIQADIEFYETQIEPTRNLFGM